MTIRLRLSQTMTALVALSALCALARAAGSLPEDAPKLPTAIDSLPGTLVKWEMIQIPEGSLTLKDPAQPGKMRTVQVKKLWMAKTELLWDLYDVYAFRLDQTEAQKAKGVDAASRPSKPYGAPDRGFGHHGNPALSMHSHAAVMFCKWLSAKTGKHYRLPTEAEWEYACRAGAAECPKLDAKALDQVAWFWTNADDKTHPAGTKQPNAWGFVDMLGNAAEWCSGLDGRYTVCGGSFEDKAPKVSCCARDYLKPAWQAEDAHTPKSIWWLSDGPQIGMRIVREE